jgi:hypothetical protein
MSQPSPLLTALQTWSANISNSFSSLALKDYIRLVWIIGGYIILRPYLDRGFRRLMESGASTAEQAEAGAKKAKTSANALRGVVDSGEEEDEDEVEKDAVPHWGKSARRRQRRFLKEIEREAERKREEEDDRDIADLLED